MHTIELYQKIVQDSKSVPPFINTTSTEHYQAFKTISKLLIMIANLIQKRCFTDKQIYEFLQEFETVASNFDEISSITLYMSCNNYINNMVVHYLDESASDEEYECASNLKKFIEMRKKYTTSI